MGDRLGFPVALENRVRPMREDYDALDREHNRR